jgi:hypothetical protein
MAEQKHPTPTPADDASAKPPQRDRVTGDLDLPDDKPKTVTGGACATGHHLPEGTIVVK